MTAVLAKRIPAIDAEEIADLLGDLPLALEQAAGYIGLTSTAPRDYLKLLRPYLQHMLSYGEVADRPGETIATLWHISVEKLRHRDPAAVDLLRIIAVLAPDPIPLDLFTHNATAETLGSDLASLVADEVRWSDAIGTITGLGLARRNGDAVVMHRLVSAAIRADTQLQRRAAAQRHALRLLRADLPGRVRETPQNKARWVKLFPHVLTAVDTELPDVRDKQIWLLERAASSRNQLWAGSDLDQVRDRVSRLIVLTETIFGANDIKVAERLTSLGTVLLSLDEHQEAVAAFRRATAIIEAVQGPHSEATGRALLAIGVELMKEGLRAEALEFLRSAKQAFDSASHADNSLWQVSQVVDSLIDQADG